jgi:predicted dehydrogenase
VWDLASDDLAIFDFLVGGLLPQRVSAYGGGFLHPKRIDVAFISLEYPQHIVANVQVSWLDPQKRRELTVVGSERMAIFNDASLDAPLWIYDQGAQIRQEPYESFEKFRILSWERDATVPKIARVEPLASEARHFLECVARRTTPQTDGKNGLRVVRILEAVSRSMAQGGAPVTMDASG